MSAKQDHYEDRLSPSAPEFILLLLDEIYEIVLWIASFSLTRTIARITGRHWDPNGSRLPEWNYQPITTPVPEIDGAEGTDGGFPVAFGPFGIEYSEPVSKAQVSAAQKVEAFEITPEEWAVMKAYNPPLLNIPLARKIKRYRAEGRTDHEAAALAGCSLSYARHYRLAFEKATRSTTGSTPPLSDR